VKARRSRASRAVATIAGASALATSWSGILAAFAPAADAAPAPDQDVLNDWGQTAAEVTEEVNLVVDAGVDVIAARTRYLHALSAYASLKQSQKVAVAAHTAALKTRSRTDDVSTARTLSIANVRVYNAAREVVASQLAMATLVNARTAAVRAQHYIQAPLITLPTAPVGLAAVGASGQISLSWTAVNGATGYRVYRDGVQIASSASPTFTDTGLDNGTPYGYAVLATNLAGWSPKSVEVVATPNEVAPGAPTGLVAAPGDGTVTLAWTATPSATSYEVFRNGTLVGSPTSPTFTDTGLTDAVAYSYTVRALNGVAVSPASGAVACTPVATAPAAPTNLVATPGNASVTLTWTASAGATSYKVYRGATLLATQAGTSFVDSSVSNGTAYTYTVVAYRLNSPASATSSPATATPVAPPLSSPTGLSATPGDAKVTLTWGSVSGATSYQVRRGGTLLATTATPGYVDSAVSNGTTYSYTVVAVGPSSSSAPTAAVTATPAAAVAGAPTGLSGVAGDRIATLTWTAVPSATSYKLYRDGVLVASPTGTTFTDSALTNGVTYAYTVSAVVAGVESAKCAPVTVTPFVLTPAAPAGLTATGGNTQVSLSWTASANATGYRVYRGATLVATQAGTTFLDTGLTNGTAYSYTVVATNGSASSPASTAVNATPMAPAPGTPTGLAATPGNASMVLTWTAVPGATAYHVYRGGVLVGSPMTATFTDTGLTNGTTYTYYVKAVTDTTEGAASTSVVATPAKPPVNGTFTGAISSIANGHGTIRVVIVITNSKITSSTGTLLTNDGSETVKINNTALPQYNTKAVAANSATITKVSGATLTLAAYKSSLQSALTAAGL
jgi:fibronectin type 3 domain-containing protein